MMIKTTRHLSKLVSILILISSPLWAKGTPEESWQDVTGTDVWRHEVDLSGANPGEHNVIIRAVDSAGNTAFGGPYNIIIDPVAGLPSVRIVYPEEGAVLRRNLDVIGIASSRPGVERVEIRLDDRQSVTADGTEYWSRVFDTADLEDGVHTLYARAIDVRGGEGKESQVQFILDRSLPEVKITSHESGAVVSGNVTFEGTADDSNSISSVSLSTDGGIEYEPLKIKTSKGETAAEFSFSLQTGKMQDGQTVYHIRSVDTTGAYSDLPFLFFIDNEAPQLAIISPSDKEEEEEEEPVSGRVIFTGTVKDVVGVDRLYYEINKEITEIEMTPGDPYWTADINLTAETGKTVSVVFSAIDKSGNRSVIQRRIQNNTAAYSPAITITSAEENDSIYGYVTGGRMPAAVEVEGFPSSYPANPGFRIPSSDIGPGRNDLKLTAVSADSISGPLVRVQADRPALPKDTLPPPPPPLSAVTVTAPEKDSYTGSAVTISGKAGSAAEGSGFAGTLQYRLSPGSSWISIDTDENSDFTVRADLSSLPDGPVHLELRTLRAGTEEAPVYHPFNLHTALPQIKTASPDPADIINGRVTVSGSIISKIPVLEITYTVDEEEYIPVEIIPAWNGAAFIFTEDFSAIKEAGKKLLINAVDAAGNNAVFEPSFQADTAGDLPQAVLNLPPDASVITDDFTISGMAFDDDGIAAIHWRIGEGDFTKEEAGQNFRIDIPFSAVESGEQILELYAEDIYGLTGDTVSSTILVSKDSPVVEAAAPEISIYNRGTVMITGTASDENGIAVVRISMDNGNTFQTAEGTENWSLSLNTSAYKDGVYSVIVTAEDNYGVESLVSSLLSIDNTPPAVSLGEPADGRLTGETLELSGRVNDNIRVQSLSAELTSVSGELRSLRFDLDPQLVILETLDIKDLPPGQYNLRVIAADPAGNEAVVVRNVILAEKDSRHDLVLFSPMPGAQHTGPLTVSGKVSGTDIPEQVAVYSGEEQIGTAELNLSGYFNFTVPENIKGDEESGRIDISAGFDSLSGETVKSLIHPVYLNKTGPVLLIESHKTGDAVNGRPWLSGTAEIILPAGEAETLGKKERRIYEASEVNVSLDNGRTFEEAKGGGEWKFRLETESMLNGIMPVIVKAYFADGSSAAGRIVVIVDNSPPSVSMTAPQEGTTHADSLLIYGTAGDEYGLEKIQFSLREGDKSGYGVPQFIQGLYLDVHALGATYGDFGIGVSFFDDNVKLQVQAGLAPPGRFTGTVLGVKMLSNIYTLPFDYFFGPDWSFFSMALAVGANFSYFTMDGDSSPLVMSAILAQWEIAKVKIPGWKNFSTYSLYVEPNYWFASSDVESGAIFKLSFGLRAGIF